MIIIYDEEKHMCYACQKNRSYPIDFKIDKLCISGRTILFVQPMYARFGNRH